MVLNALGFPAPTTPEIDPIKCSPRKTSSCPGRRLCFPKGSYLSRREAQRWPRDGELSGFVDNVDSVAPKLSQQLFIRYDDETEAEALARYGLSPRPMRNGTPPKG